MKKRPPPNISGEMLGGGFVVCRGTPSSTSGCSNPLTGVSYTCQDWGMPNQPKTRARTVRVDDELWDAAQAEAERTGVKVSDIVRKALRQMLAGAPVLLALVALLVWGGREVQAPWGETQGPTFTQAQVAQWSQQIVDEQVAALGCSKTPALTERVAVRNAVGFDRGVVKVVSFDEGFAAGQAGKIFVVGWCA